MLDWLDVLPDMRISGVQGVHGVQPQKTGGFECTPTGVHGCASTPAATPAHLVHTLAHPVHTLSTPQKTAENRHSTPCTPCTPNFGIGLCRKPGEVGEWATLLRDRAAGTAPSSVTLERWGQVLADASGFLETWGAQAVAMGWTSYELFAVPPGPERWLLGGLVALLRGRKVVAITADAITIANPKGEPHRYRRNPNPGAVMLWDERGFEESKG